MLSKIELNFLKSFKGWGVISAVFHSTPSNILSGIFVGCLRRIPMHCNVGWFLSVKTRRRVLVWTRIWYDFQLLILKLFQVMSWPYSLQWGPHPHPHWHPPHQVHNLLEGVICQVALQQQDHPRTNPQPIHTLRHSSWPGKSSMSKIFTENSKV